MCAVRWGSCNSSGLARLALSSAEATAGKPAPLASPPRSGIPHMQVVNVNRSLKDSTMDIWNLHTTSWTKFLLWRTSETKFRVVQHGEPLTLLTNSDYILIDKKYQSILHKLNGQVTFVPVTIVDQVRQLTFDNYLELKILNQIRIDQIKPVESNGLKIWQYSDQYVFVSSDLKQEFQKVSKDEFEFTIGFSHFAGTETDSASP